MQSLERKILLTVVVVTLSATGLGSFLVAGYQGAELRKATQRRLGEVAQMVTVSVEDTMILNRPEVTRRLLNTQNEHLQGYEQVAVFDHTGRQAFGKDENTYDRRFLDPFRKRTEPFVHVADGRMIIYSPLVNGSSCDGCHTNGRKVLGAVRVSASLAPDERSISRVRLGGAVGAVLIAALVSLLSWFLLRRIVVGPVAGIEAAAVRMAQGDLASPPPAGADDEVGRTATALASGLQVIGGTLTQVRDVVGQAAQLSREFSGEARRLLDATRVEAESFERITGAMEDFEGSAGEIGQRADGLVAAADEVKAAIDEMADRVERISHTSADLFGAVEEIGRTTRQISGFAESIERSTRGLDRQAEETLHTLELITSTSTDIESLTGDSAELSRQVVHEASTVGIRSMDETMEGMEAIRRSAGSTAESISRLGTRSEEIAAILAVIDEITDQTALLALNAAIIAAQAGEHGKGFAVVAEEIKDLADRAAASTQEIAQLVANVRQEVGDAVAGVSSLTTAVDQGLTRSAGAARALEDIVSLAQRSSETSAKVRERIGHQTRAASESRGAMESVRAEVRRIAQSMAVQARDMHALQSAADNVHEVATYVRGATEEQESQAGRVRSQTDAVHEGAREIASLVAGQRRGAREITELLHELSSLPERNRELSVRIDAALQRLAAATAAAAETLSRFRLGGGDPEADPDTDARGRTP